MAFMSGRLLEVCPNQASGSLLPQALRIILSVGKRGEGPGASMGNAPGHFSLSNAFPVFGKKKAPCPPGKGGGKGPMGVPVRGGDYSRESRTSESEVGMLGSKNFGAEALSMLRSLSTRSASSAVPMLRFKSWSS